MDEPRLMLVESSQGIDEALVFIDGYFSQGREQLKESWISAIRQAGWQGSIYHLWWDASERSVTTAAKLLVIGQWKMAKNRAERTGNDYLFQKLSEEIKESYVSLMGYSLGARVIFYGLKSSSIQLKAVKNVIFLAGAISRNKEWNEVTSKLTGKIINIYNREDETLKYIYTSGQFSNHSACGIRPIEFDHTKIVNVDATSLISSSSHSGKHYRRILAEVVGKQFWSLSTYSNKATDISINNFEYEKWKVERNIPVVQSSAQEIKKSKDETVLDIAKDATKEVYRGGKSGAKEVYRGGKSIAKGIKKGFKSLGDLF